MTKKDLSIIIVNYKTPQLVKECVASIKKYPPNFSYEIIVIDNSVNNVGFAKGNNIGIKRSKGKYILLLNSDTIVKKGSIDKLIENALENEDAGAVVPRLLNTDGTTQSSAFTFPSIFSNSKKYIPQSKTVEGAVMAAFLITPKGLEKAGLLNEKYFMFFEDIDYCRRLKKLGLKIYYVRDAEVVHLHGESGKNLVDEMNQWRRLVPSSIQYHGKLTHYLIYFRMLLQQKFGVYLILISLLTIPVVFNLLRPGYFPMQDDLQAFRVQQMDKCLDDFQIPCRWVPDAGYQYGYPQFNFYPPLPYYVGALIHRLGLQYIDSVKILFIAGYILAAFAMYILVSELTNKWSGFVASILYTYIPYKAVEVYVRGALSEFWAQIFFPLILWSIYKLIKTGKTAYIVLMGVSIAFLATTHALMTMIFAGVAVFWAIYWLFQEKWNNLFKVVWGELIGFGLSAFFTLPMFFEKKFVHVESVLSGYFDYRQHFVSLYKLFLSTEWGYGSSGFPNEKLNLSLGIVQWVVGIGAVLLALISFKKSRKTSILTLLISGITLFSIFMMHMKSSFIWAELPALWYLQFPWRFLAISIFLLCLLSGFFIYFLGKTKYFSGKFKYLIGTILILISIFLNISFFVPKAWLNITDDEKFSGISWEKQLTISIFDYLPIYGTLPPWSKAPEFPEVLEGNVKFLEYKKGSNYQMGVVEALEDSRIRIPLFDFPGIEVRVDTKIVEHVNNDCRYERYCRGLITFNIPKGKHSIEARLKDTPIRTLGNSLTLISLLKLTKK